MARDLALTQSARADARAVLRIYEWHRATVSFGRNEAVQTSWDVEAMLAAGYDVVRRPTGGRALLHSREVTWSVTLPVPDDIPWRTVYDAVNARLLIALQSVGVPATLHAGERSDASALRDGTRCYAQPSAGELVFGGAKLAGSSVWRAHGGYLQHGSILLENEQERLSPFARGLSRQAETAHRISSVGEALRASPSDTERVTVAAPGVAETDTRLRDALARAFGVASTSSYRIVETPAYQLAFSSAREQLGSSEWLWRR
jgi:lipoate-protein ligase A